MLFLSRNNTIQQDDVYIVGIGASAGGLEAINDLFDHVSDSNNMAGRQTVHDIPMVIFTTFFNVNNVHFCKNYGTACITKRMRYNHLHNTIKQLVSHCNNPRTTYYFKTNNIENHLIKLRLPLQR